MGGLPGVWCLPRMKEQRLWLLKGEVCCEVLSLFSAHLDFNVVSPVLKTTHFSFHHRVESVFACVCVCVRVHQGALAELLDMVEIGVTVFVDGCHRVVELNMWQSEGDRVDWCCLIFSSRGHEPEQEHKVEETTTYITLQPSFLIYHLKSRST